MSEIDVGDRAWSAVERAVNRSSSVDLDWLGPLPPPHAWPLDADSLRFVAALVRELRPDHVLELGSGLSTRVIAHSLVSCTTGGQLSSVENDPYFAARVGKALDEDGTADRVGVQLAPLVLRYLDNIPVPVYLLKTDDLASPKPASLVLIDGPSALLGGRRGTLHQAMELIEPGTVILLDDADRTSEQHVLGDWREAFGDAIEIRSFPKRLPCFAVVVVSAPAIPTRGRWWLEEPRDWADKAAALAEDRSG